MRTLIFLVADYVLVEADDARAGQVVFHRERSQLSRDAHRPLVEDRDIMLARADDGCDGKPSHCSGSAVSHPSNAASPPPLRLIGVPGALFGARLRHGIDELSIWAGLPGSSPQGHVFNMTLEGTRWRGAACSGCPSPRDEAV